MCNTICIIRSLTANKFEKYSRYLNFFQIVLNCLIILFTILCFISCEINLIIKTGYANYINNILFSLIMILIIILIEYYHHKNYLIKDKKQTSSILIFLCLSITIIKSFNLLIAIAKLKRIYSIDKNDAYSYQKNYIKIYKQTKILSAYLLILLALFFILGIFWLIYLILFFNLRIIILNNDINNAYYNRNNISYISTKPDMEDNSQEIIINNINEEGKNNNFSYLSQNIINKIQKEYENKEVQTNIKGNL